MCRGCWSHYQPAEVTPSVLAAAEAITALYREHSTGGWLHVVVDGWNLPVGPDYWDDMDHQPDALERACFDALVGLTEDEQATALAIHEGFLAWLRVPPAETPHLYAPNGDPPCSD